MPLETFNLSGLLPVLGKLHDGAMLVDHNMTISFANQAAHQIFDYKTPELIGANISVLIPEQHRKQHKKHSTDYINNPAPRIMNSSMRLEGIDKNNNPIPLLVSLDPIETENEKMILVSIRDIRVIVKMETELFHARKLETIGKTASGIIHDLNNVLQVIYSSSHQARKCPEGNAHKYLDDIDAQATLATSILRSLLSYLQQGAPEAARLNLNETVGNFQPILNSILPKEIQLSLNIDKEEHFIHSTSTVIDQILLNLVINSNDAVTGVETPEITLSLAAAETEGEAVLSVRDNGCGMSEEVKQNAFKTFFTTKTDKGTGLGLANIYGAVIDLDGRIDIDSCPGKGTTFKITLPTLP